MDDSVFAAIRCFQENKRDFGNPTANPENFNLYNGLANLAEGVGRLQDQLSALALEVQQMRRELAKR